ncbi:hypothetical protein EYF80_034132 [Liparis tanakae]|uniref:Secreted protein n=1 Tax=Liparis tanakae TaxID=230148 RepID=A0A4Z2GQ84_9TELE|nr:hypothetical protein EYF80_034132 [Liparis tanakae]
MSLRSCVLEAEVGVLILLLVLCDGSLHGRLDERPTPPISVVLQQHDVHGVKGQFALDSNAPPTCLRQASLAVIGCQVCGTQRYKRYTTRTTGGVC